MAELKPEAPRFYVERSNILKWHVTDRKTNKIIADGYSHAYKAKKDADQRNKDAGCTVTIGYLEPWRYVEQGDGDEIDDADGNIIWVSEYIDDDHELRGERENERRNFRRIVACVNACAGIETEELENVLAYLDGNECQKR